MTDLFRLLRRWGEYLCQVNARVAPVQRVVESAASSDPQIADLLKRIKNQRLAGQSVIAELLAERGALRLSTSEAADIIFALSDAHLYDIFVLDRGWPEVQLQRWLGDALCSLLLPSNA